ncbi:MAG TPA: N-acetylmuramoyl-L-alanine amidase [Bacteroidales bacterium]|nr:N-acetylmuramoyl-L-alanine amidase [Bacteroidales bacterium]
MTHHIIHNIKRVKTLFLASLLLIINSQVPLFSQQQYKTKIQTVVIDAGHGGKDTGALGSFSYEKDVVLAIALKLGEYIKQNFTDVKVIYTRDSDVFVPLHERADIANKNNADLFISIHANANDNHNAYGTETYAMGLHTNERNLEVAKKENSVITLEDDYTTRYEGFDPNSTESYIIFSLMQNTFLSQSLNFASFVQEEFKDRARRLDRGVKQAGFLVLWKTSMPSVLVETGFISNTSEEKFLNSETGQDYIASAIFRAFRDYKNNIESKSHFVAISAPPQQSSITENKNTTDNNPDSGKDSLASIPQTIVSSNKGDIRYKVQITASSNPIPFQSDFFKPYKKLDGFDHLEEFPVSGSYKYAIGNASSYEEIKNLNEKIKKYFPDAFIIAVKDGVIIPIYEALKDQNK